MTCDLNNHWMFSSGWLVRTSIVLAPPALLSLEEQRTRDNGDILKMKDKEEKQIGREDR